MSGDKSKQYKLLAVGEIGGPVKWVSPKRKWYVRLELWMQSCLVHLAFLTAGFLMGLAVAYF